MEKKYKLISIAVLVCLIASTIAYGKDKLDKTGELINVAPIANIGAKVSPRKINIDLFTDYSDLNKLLDIQNRLTQLNTKLAEKNIQMCLNGEPYNSSDIAILTKYKFATGNNNTNKNITSIDIVKANTIKGYTNNSYFDSSNKSIDGNILTDYNNNTYITGLETSNPNADYNSLIYYYEVDAGEPILATQLQVKPYTTGYITSYISYYGLEASNDKTNWETIVTPQEYSFGYTTKYMDLPTNIGKYRYFRLLTKGKNWDGYYSSRLAEFHILANVYDVIKNEYISGYASDRNLYYPTTSLNNSSNILGDYNKDTYYSDSPTIIDYVPTNFVYYYQTTKENKPTLAKQLQIQPYYYGYHLNYLSYCRLEASNDKTNWDVLGEINQFNYAYSPGPIQHDITVLNLPDNNKLYKYYRIGTRGTNWDGYFDTKVAHFRIMAPTNLTPKINEALPKYNSVFLKGDIIEPTVKVTDSEGDSLTCSYNIDGGTTIETKSIDKTLADTTKEQNIIFSNYNTDNLENGTHYIEYTVNDGQESSTYKTYFKLMNKEVNKVDSYSIFLSDTKVPIENQLYQYLFQNDYTNYGVSPSWDYKDSNLENSISIRELINNTKGKLFNTGQFQQSLDDILYKYTNKDVNIELFTDYTDENKLNTLKSTINNLGSDLKSYDVNLKINNKDFNLLSNNDLTINKLNKGIEKNIVETETPWEYFNSTSEWNHNLEFYYDKSYKYRLTVKNFQDNVWDNVNFYPTGTYKYLDAYGYSIQFTGQPEKTISLWWTLNDVPIEFELTQDKSYYCFNKVGYAVSDPPGTILFERKKINHPANINIISPLQNEVFQDGILTPKIKVNDADKDTLTCSYKIDDGVVIDSKTLNNSSIDTTVDQVLTFKDINISTLSLGTHKLSYSVKDQFSENITSIYFRIVPKMDNTDNYSIFLSDEHINIEDGLKKYLEKYSFSTYGITPSSTYDYVDVNIPNSVSIRQLIDSTNGGLFDTGQVNECLQAIREKILSKLGLGSKPIYICTDESIEYIKYYKDYEDDPQNNERFKYSHDWTLFENNTGPIINNNFWVSDEITQFNKTGKYVISYQAQDNPTGRILFNNYNKWSKGENQLTLIVHNRPIADFEYKINNSTLSVSISDKSYDIDHYSESGKGIVDRKFKWRNIKDLEWNYSEIPSPLVNKETYIVSLEVKDKEGAWSYPTTKIFTIGENHKPVAKFSLNKMSMYQGEVNNITDLSYDPDEDPLAEWHWFILDDTGTTIINDCGGTKPNLSVLPSGSYSIGLLVRDNPVIPPSLWSDIYILPINIIDNLSVDGQVNHTIDWNNNRIKYNREKTNTDDSPRTYDVFFPGEKFMLKALTTEGAACNKVIVHIQEYPDFYTELTNTNNNIWEGSIWDKTMLDWKDQNLNFEFNAIYSNGTIKTDVVPVKVLKDEYWRIHRDF